MNKVCPPLRRVSSLYMCTSSAQMYIERTAVLSPVLLLICDKAHASESPRGWISDAGQRELVACVRIGTEGLLWFELCKHTHMPSGASVVHSSLWRGEEER